MNTASHEFSQILAALQEYDGKLWLRILGQTHWQYDELPFWVLLKERSEIKQAISVLQTYLKPLQDTSGANITVSFITFEGDQDCSHGYFKGRDFFAGDVLNEIYAEPECSVREIGLFDHEYPNDPWAMKETRFN
jgi:hypothetical protein